MCTKEYLSIHLFLLDLEVTGSGPHLPVLKPINFD